MANWANAKITIDASEETKAKIAERKRFANATDAEREEMADAEQKRWDAANSENE